MATMSRPAGIRINAHETYATTLATDVMEEELILGYYAWYVLFEYIFLALGHLFLSFFFSLLLLLPLAVQYDIKYSHSFWSPLFY